jgi:hypothetical protein
MPILRENYGYTVLGVRVKYHIIAWMYISATFVLFSQMIKELSKTQCNYDFAHILPLALKEAHTALQGEGFDSRKAQYMHPSILDILVQV